jgi:peroxiredoxin
MNRLRTDHQPDTRLNRSRAVLLARALAVLLAAALLAQGAHVALGREATGAEAPDFALKSVAGSNLRLSEYRSDVVALAFWASWCGECREGLARLEALQQAHAAEGLQVLAVSFDEDAGAAAEAARAARVSFPVLLDGEGETGRLYDVDDLPFVVLVDRAGQRRGSYEGGRAGTVQALTADVRALLAE